MGDPSATTQTMGSSICVICGSPSSLPSPSQRVFPEAMQAADTLCRGAFRIGGLGGLLEAVETGYGASGAFGFFPLFRLALDLRLLASCHCYVSHHPVLGHRRFDEVGERLPPDPRICRQLAGP